MFKSQPTPTYIVIRLRRTAFLRKRDRIVHLGLIGETPSGPMADVRSNENALRLGLCDWKTKTVRIRTKCPQGEAAYTVRLRGSFKKRNGSSIG